MAKNSIPIGEQVEKFFFGVSRAQLKRDSKELSAQSFKEGFKEGIESGEDEPPSGDLLKFGYRSITKGLRDFSATKREVILRTLWSIWQSSPIAKRLLHIKRGYIMGGGVKPSSKDEKINDVVTSFWEDNQLDKMRAKEFCLQLFLFGYQVYPVFVREADGRVRLGYIDPLEVERVITDPENSMENWAIQLKENLVASSDSWATSHEKRVFRIVRKAENVVVNNADENGDITQSVTESEHEGLLVTHTQVDLEEWEIKMLKAFGLKEYSGSCFYTKVNSVSNQPYGYSDLLQLLDWIDQADAVLFALGEREQMADYFAFDVEITGDEKAVDKRAKELAADPPRKGSVNVHNQAEKWTLHSPDLHQTGSVESFNALITFILGGMGFPRHWFGYGDETNRATAQAQADPTWRSLQDDQGIVGDMFTGMCNFARDQAVIASTLEDYTNNDDSEIVVQMPEMTKRDVSMVAQAMGSIALALVSAREAGWITQETAAAAWAKIMGELDIEIDVTTELEKVAKQVKDQDIEDYKARVDRLQQKIAQLGGGAVSADDDV